VGVDSLRRRGATIFVAAVFSRQSINTPTPNKTANVVALKRFLVILLGTGMVSGESWIATSAILRVDKALSFLKDSASIVVRLIEWFDGTG
jgi:hypothetical protein